MGSSRWDAGDWASYSTTTSAKPRAAIFTSRAIDDSLNPLKIGIRESVDSAANPASTPIIIAVDETGSMGHLAELIIKKGLGTIMGEIYDRKPVTDPHIMCMGVGDAAYDEAPIQVTQFEASIVLTEQVEKIYLEGGGGGNAGESYNLAWYFAAFKTKCDAITKRGRKGYIFTIGDEAPLGGITKDQIKRFFGDDIQGDLSNEDLLAVLSPNWEVFHLIVKPVTMQPVKAKWTELLGQRAVSVSDHEKLAEVIVSTIQVTEGHDAAAVSSSWSGDTSLVVANAISGLAKTDTAGVVRL